MVQKSEDIKELATALCLAQSEFENAKKTSSNPFFKSKYADLAEVLDTIKPVLNRHGLSVTQFPCFEGGICQVETILIHTSGQWISGIAGTPLVKQDPQAVGAAISYLRRYSLAAVCGIAQEDDDGNSASGKTEKEAPIKVVSSQDQGSTWGTPVSDKTLNKLMALIVKQKIGEEIQAGFLKWANSDRFEKISEEQALKLITRIQGKI